MTQMNAKQNSIGKKRWLIKLGIAMLIIAAALWWRDRNPTAVPDLESTQPSRPHQAYTKSAEAGKPPTEKDIEQARQTAIAQLKEAARAVDEAKPLQGTVARRPDFVAEFEWDLLLEMAASDPDQEATLTQLVNKLLFFKKYEAWESLLTSGNSVNRRHALAEEILTMIPGQMQVLGPEQAREMENELHADLAGRS